MKNTSFERHTKKEEHMCSLKHKWFAFHVSAFQGFHLETSPVATHPCCFLRSPILVANSLNQVNSPELYDRQGSVRGMKLQMCDATPLNLNSLGSRTTLGRARRRLNMRLRLKSDKTAALVKAYHLKNGGFEVHFLAECSLLVLLRHRHCSLRMGNLISIPGIKEMCPALWADAVWNAPYDRISFLRPKACLNSSGG